MEAVGSAVSRFKVGDQVFAFTGAGYGCHAEYRTMEEAGLIARKPEPELRGGGEPLVWRNECPGVPSRQGGHQAR